MKVITKDHKYCLANFEGEGCQTIQFIEKEKGEGDELVTINDGTTNEEVLKMLIDRLRGLNKKFPCEENANAIAHLEAALRALNARTQRRAFIGIEGTHKPDPVPPKVPEIMIDGEREVEEEDLSDASETAEPMIDYDPTDDHEAIDPVEE
jgi:ethanolamine ammonia-lyase large subunit